jgi:hypothetical protein
MSILSRYTDTPTQQVVGNNPTLLQFTPMHYFGHPSGCTVESYDVFNGVQALKQFKVSVSSIGEEPILRLDTFDLYFGGDHTIRTPSTLVNASFSQKIGAAKPGTPYKGNPVRFQKIHFRAHKENSEVEEYYAIFLASDPVKITKNSVIGAGDYLDKNNPDCPPLQQSTDVCRTDVEEQGQKSEIVKWNDLSYITESSSYTTPTLEQFKNRLIVGDSLHSQGKSLSSLDSSNCIKDTISCSERGFQYEFLAKNKDNGKIVGIPISAIYNMVIKLFSDNISNTIVTNFNGKTAQICQLKCDQDDMSFVISPDCKDSPEVQCNCSDGAGASSLLFDISDNIFNIPKEYFEESKIDPEIQSILFD